MVLANAGCPSAGLGAGDGLDIDLPTPRSNKPLSAPALTPKVFVGSPRDMGVTPVVSMLVRDHSERCRASQAVLSMTGGEQHYLVRIGALDAGSVRGINAAYWCLVKRVSDVVGNSPRSVHEFFVREFLPELAHRLMQQDEPLTRLLSPGQFSYLLKQSSIHALVEWGVP